MKVLVTGAGGLVGGAAVSRLALRGHHVIGVTRESLDLRDLAAVRRAVSEVECVIHSAAIAGPELGTPEEILENNVMTTFILVEAARTEGVRRFVYLSSETVTGLPYAHRPTPPLYIPIDEDYPLRPQSAYGLSKLIGEQIVEAGVASSAMTAVSLRPGWVQTPDSYEENLRSLLERGDDGLLDRWTYTDIDDLMDAVELAMSASVEGHQALYVVNPDNIGGWDTASEVRRSYGEGVEIRLMHSVDAAGITSDRAWQVLGWRGVRSWRDYMVRYPAQNEEAHNREQG